jgi:catechol 2,3-dioxygenase-like lactoylglutathione lyase family enzyme
MRLNHVTIPVADIDRAVDFYLRLGLRQIVAAPHYARFVSPEGDATLSIDKVDTVSTGTVIYFECDDLDDQVARLKARGIAFDADPADQPWLWRETRCQDPDGNAICLYSAGHNRLHPPWELVPPRRR